MAHALLTAQGYTLTSVASVVSAAVGILADMAVSKELTKRVETTAEAIEYLENNGIVNILGSKRRNNKTLIDALSQEDIRFDRQPASTAGTRVTTETFDPVAFREELARRQQDDAETKEHLGVVPEGLVKDE